MRIMSQEKPKVREKIFVGEATQSLTLYSHLEENLIIYSRFDLEGLKVFQC